MFSACVFVDSLFALLHAENHHKEPANEAALVWENMHSTTLGHNRIKKGYVVLGLLAKAKLRVRN
jgi:hypothetical protein